MVEDRSLDEFAADADTGGDAADAATSDGDRSDADTKTSDTDRNDADTETSGTVTATATWTTEGADCDRCGEPVSRRWRDGDALVCADCKGWSE